MVIRYLFVARKSSNARYRRASILHIGQLETRLCGCTRDAATVSKTYQFIEIYIMKFTEKAVIVLFTSAPLA